MERKSSELEALVLDALVDLAIDRELAKVADILTKAHSYDRIVGINLFHQLMGVDIREAKMFMDQAFERYLKANPTWEAYKTRADKMKLAERHLTDAVVAVANIIKQNLATIEAGLDGPMSQRLDAWIAVGEIREGLVKWDQASHHFGDVIGGRA